MKRINKRIIALLLCTSLLIAFSNVGIYANDISTEKNDSMLNIILDADDLITEESGLEISASKKGLMEHYNGNSISDFDAENALDMSAGSNGIAAATSPIAPTSAPVTFYTSVTDSLTAPGTPNSTKYIYPITLYPYQVLHIQAEFNIANDFDLMLYEVNSLGQLTAMVDYSGTTGTNFEAVGVVNRSNSTKDYAVFIQSFKGAGAFTMHIGIANEYDGFEADENPFKAVILPTLPAVVSAVTINSRAFYTHCDTDWYKFTLPSGTFGVELKLTNAPGYKVELYSVTPSAHLTKQNPSNGVYSLNDDVYYIRVTSTVMGATAPTGNNYTLQVIVRYVQLNNIVANWQTSSQIEAKSLLHPVYVNFPGGYINKIDIECNAGNNYAYFHSRRVNVFYSDTGSAGSYNYVGTIYGSPTVMGPWNNTGLSLSIPRVATGYWAFELEAWQTPGSGIAYLDTLFSPKISFNLA